jgi:hypothetical protein
LFRAIGPGKFVDATAAAGLERKSSLVGCIFADIFGVDPHAGIFQQVPALMPFSVTLCLCGKN